MKVARLYSYFPFGEISNNKPDIFFYQNPVFLYSTRSEKLINCKNDCNVLVIGLHNKQLIHSFSTNQNALFS